MPHRLSSLRTIISAFATAAFLPAATVAADSDPLVWRWSNPTPHGNNIIDMAYTNGLWIQVSERGQIYTSGDLLTWLPRESHTTNALRSVAFFQERIVAVGEAGTVVQGISAAEFTAMRLPTDDWLEGVAASPDRLVAVGDNAAIYTSSDAQIWTRQTVPFTSWLRSVAYGTPAIGGRFVAVGETGFVAVSVDGIAWQIQTALGADDLNRVTWSDGAFWIAGDNGSAFTGASGTTWTSLNTDAADALNAIASSGSAQLIAGAAELWLREGTGRWGDELSTAKDFPAPEWTYLSALWDGTSFLLGGRTGMLVEGFKPTGATDFTWAPFSDSLRNWLWDMERVPGLYVAVGDHATILSSLDGISWQQELAADSATNSVLLGVGGSTNRLVAAGSAGSIIYSVHSLTNVVSTDSEGQTVTNEVSTLGIVWNDANPPPTSADLQGVAHFRDSFVVTGGGGVILTSPDAITWTKRASPTAAFLSGVAALGDVCVVVGDDGAIVRTEDAITWTLVPAPTTNWLYRVRALNGQLVAVGQNGSILTSSDGLNWMPRPSGTTRWLNEVVYAGNAYFAVGNQGAVLRSSDTTQWIEIGTITQKSLYAAAANDTQLVIAGIEGIILRTHVEPVTTPIQFLEYPREPSARLFLFSGEPDQQFRLDRSTNLIDWTPGPTLEFSDATGTLIYLDEVENAESQQFFRASPP